jgi:hypothetical protein
MKRLLLLTAIPIFVVASAPVNAHAQNTREVILATRRNHRVVVFDARSLSELGSFIVSEGAEGVNVSADGRMLYLRQPPPAHPNSCCALFSLELSTGSLCELIYPSSRGVATPDGRLLFTQRGNIGVEVFDAKSLARLPVIKAPGGYELYVSPDSRWLFGAASWVDPSLDVFDLQRREMVRRIALPAGLIPHGVWLADRFYLYAHDGKQGKLWRVTEDTSELGSAKEIPLPIARGDGKPSLHRVIAAGDRLIVYEPLGWWLKTDRDSVETGGMFSIDPSTGAFDQLAATTNFTQVVASQDGRNLFGIDAGGGDKTRPPRLLKLDSRSGMILKKRDLALDVWHISAARLPESLIPRGEMSTPLCQNPNAGMRQ